MACINADGSLSPIAQKVLLTLNPPATVYEINQKSGIPLYRVRASLRELADLGMLVESSEYYSLTDIGKKKLVENKG